VARLREALVTGLGDEVAALTDLGGEQASYSRTRAQHPNGFEPGVRWNGKDGELSTGPLPVAPTCWDHLLRSWDLDPAEVEVVEPVERRSWDAAVGGGTVQRMHYFKAKVRRRSHGPADVDELLAEVRRWKPSKRIPPSGDLAFVHVTADLQAGKPDGDGTAGMVRRYLAGLDHGVARLKELRRMGQPIGPVYLPWLGDCIEGTGGHYAMQTFGVELNLTEQVRLVRRMALAQVKAYAPLAERVVVPVVPGNHDEAVRQGGKASTSFSDSFATDALSAVADVCAESAALEHVSFVFPQGQELTLTLDIAGTVTTLAHGHQFRGKPMTWWANQAHGMQPAGDSTLLLAGHEHHLQVLQSGAKTFIRAQALDGGSTWWRHQTGQDAPPGVLTMTVGRGGWGALDVA
jgi:predicted phosphodiesterase